jgi:hypothetical protein
MQRRAIMTVNDDVRRVVPFGHLSVGDTFLKEDRRFLYMKTVPMTLGGHKINAVVLNNGSVTTLDDEDKVIFVECETNILREGY